MSLSRVTFIVLLIIIIILTLAFIWYFLSGIETVVPVTGIRFVIVRGVPTLMWDEQTVARRYLVEYSVNTSSAVTSTTVPVNFVVSPDFTGSGKVISGKIIAVPCNGYPSTPASFYLVIP